MCEGKRRYSYDQAAAEAFRQASHYPHYLWSFYECLWCDYSHIGRRSVAPGHGPDCEVACARKSRQDREWRIIEGIW